MKFFSFLKKLIKILVQIFASQKLKQKKIALKFFSKYLIRGFNYLNTRNINYIIFDVMIHSIVYNNFINVMLV